MIRFKCAACAGLSIVLTAGAASAQQAQTYTYDVHGRLTDSTRTTGSSSQTTSYALDKAHNRTNRSTSAPTTGRSGTPVGSAETNEAAKPAEASAVPGNGRKEGQQ